MSNSNQDFIMDDVELRLARDFTAQTEKAKIICPKCKSRSIEQPLCRTGDFEEVLFCPHCKLEICISVVLFDRPW